jgi:hypothetical protein
LGSAACLEDGGLSLVLNMVLNKVFVDAVFADGFYWMEL